MTTFIIFLLAVMSLLGWTLAGVHARERDILLKSLEETSAPEDPCEKYPEECDEEKEPSEYERLNSRITDVEQLSHANKHASIEIAGAFDKIEEQVNHLATVQSLILKDLKKEHHIEPARDVLVTIGNLSDLKNKKERTA